MSHILVLLCLSLLSDSRLVNVTIDDYPGAAPTGATLTYAPDGDWLPLPTAGDSSTYKIDYARVHGGTLHTGPWPDGNLTLTFVGTMIYLFLVLDAGWNNDLFFYLDGAAQPSGRFYRPGDDSVDVYLYNQLVHKSDTLAMGTHSMRMAVSSIPRIFFDFAVFSTEVDDDADVSAPSRASTSASQSRPSSSPPGGLPTSGTALPATGSPGAPEVGPQSGTRTPGSLRTTTSTGNHAQSSKTSDDATAVRTTGSISGSESGTRSSVNTPAVVGASIAGVVVVATLCACIIWRRRRRSQLAVLEPFDAPSALHVPRETASWRVESAENADRDETSLLPREKFRGHQAGTSLAAPQLPPSALFEYSDSEGTRSELERVRGENERVLAEMAMLRQAGIAPPPYSDKR